MVNHGVEVAEMYLTFEDSIEPPALLRVKVTRNPQISRRTFSAAGRGRSRVFYSISRKHSLSLSMITLLCDNNVNPTR